MGECPGKPVISRKLITKRVFNPMPRESNGISRTRTKSILLYPDNRCAKMSYSPHETSQAHSLNNLANQVQKAFNPQELVHTVPPRSSMDNFATDQTGQRHAKSGGEFSTPVKSSTHPVQ